MKSSCRFKPNKQTRPDYSFWQILSLVCPLKYHVTQLSSHAKMAGIVNKVYCYWDRY